MDPIASGLGARPFAWLAMLGGDAVWLALAINTSEWTVTGVAAAFTVLSVAAVGAIKLIGGAYFQMKAEGLKSYETAYKPTLQRKLAELAQKNDQLVARLAALAADTDRAIRSLADDVARRDHLIRMLTAELDDCRAELRALDSKPDPAAAELAECQEELQARDRDRDRNRDAPPAPPTDRESTHS